MVMENLGVKERLGEHRKAMKSMFWGVTLILLGCGFWYSLVGNPLHDLRLIQRGRTIPGYIIDAWEDVGDDDHGRAVWSHGVTYTYQLPDGREFQQNTSEFPGALRDEFRDLQEPYPVEVEYLPEDPLISRIKGTGSDSITDWLWRKAGLGTLLLLMCLSPGVALLQDCVRELRRRRVSQPDAIQQQPPDHSRNMVN